MKLPVVLDGSYKAGVVYGLQMASFNALLSARQYYARSKQFPMDSIPQLLMLERMNASNSISMQMRRASRTAWESTG